MSACSGTGLFELVFRQIIQKINARLETAGEAAVQARFVRMTTCVGFLSVSSSTSLALLYKLY